MQQASILYTKLLHRIDIHEVIDSHREQKFPICSEAKQDPTDV